MIGVPNHVKSIENTPGLPDASVNMAGRDKQTWDSSDANQALAEHIGRQSDIAWRCICQEPTGAIGLD